MLLLQLVRQNASKHQCKVDVNTKPEAVSSQQLVKSF
uniref:Uncharacterized protein n=1 Tax=Arundo donax TaxID=35708 RepID=A0A0A9E071_ARUDO